MGRLRQRVRQAPCADRSCACCANWLQGESAAPGSAAAPAPVAVVEALVGEAFARAPWLQHLLLAGPAHLADRAELARHFAPVREPAEAAAGQQPGGLRLYRCSRSALQPPLAVRLAREEDCDELLRRWRAAASSEPHLVQLQVGAAWPAGRLSGWLAGGQAGRAHSVGLHCRHVDRPPAGCSSPASCWTLLEGRRGIASAPGRAPELCASWIIGSQPHLARLPQGLFPSLEAGGEAGALMALAQGRVDGAVTLVAEDEEGQLVGGWPTVSRLLGLGLLAPLRCAVLLPGWQHV
jgi:hypothetical protein